MKSLILLGVLFAVYGGSEKRYESLELQVDLSHIRHAVVVWNYPTLLLRPSPLRRYVIDTDSRPSWTKLPGTRDVVSVPYDGLDPPYEGKSFRSPWFCFC